MSSFKSFFNQTWVVALLVVIFGVIIIYTASKSKAVSSDTEDKK